MRPSGMTAGRAARAQAQPRLRQVTAHPAQDVRGGGIVKETVMSCALSSILPTSQDHACKLKCFNLSCRMVKNFLGVWEDSPYTPRARNSHTYHHREAFRARARVGTSSHSPIFLITFQKDSINKKNGAGNVWEDGRQDKSTPVQLAKKVREIA